MFSETKIDLKLESNGHVKRNVIRYFRSRCSINRSLTSLAVYALKLKNKYLRNVSRIFEISTKTLQEVIDDVDVWSSYRILDYILFSLSKI